MSPTSYPVVQAQPVAPENLPFWAKCQEALEQSASSRFIPTAYLLAIRSIISVLLTAHVILFFISGEYRLNQLQGLSALVLAISSILLVVASLISLVGSFPGRSAFISTFLLIIPLLQGSLPQIQPHPFYYAIDHLIRFSFHRRYEVEIHGEHSRSTHGL